MRAPTRSGYRPCRLRSLVRTVHVFKPVGNGMVIRITIDNLSVLSLSCAHSRLLSPSTHVLKSPSTTRLFHLPLSTRYSDNNSSLATAIIATPLLGISPTCQLTTETDSGSCVIDALPAVLLPITMLHNLCYPLIARALLWPTHKEHALQTHMIHLLVLCLLLESTTTIYLHMVLYDLNLCNNSIDWENAGSDKEVVMATGEAGAIEDSRPCESRLRPCLYIVNAPFTDTRSSSSGFRVRHHMNAPSKSL